MTVETIYDVDGGWVLHGDCVDGMKTLADNSVDSVVTDPPYGIAILGREWDSFTTTEAFERWTERWAREALRVLKPGGHAVVFCGDRMYQRMACGVEDAGFEVRHLIAWIRSDGFPKGMNVAQSIEQRVLGLSDRKKADLTTEEAKAWEGWNTTLKVCIEPILLARKTISEKTVTDNVRKHGTGAMNIDATRLVSEERASGTHQHQEGTVFRGLGHDTFEYDGTLGRWPPSVAFECTCDADHLDANEDGVLIHGDPTCPCAQLDAEAGTQVKGQIVKRGKVLERTYSESGWPVYESELTVRTDVGGVSRFFYCSKASPKERMGSKHVSIKPLPLMRWLVRLITPPNGLVLDPFCGSGSTLVAARQHGFRFVGMDIDDASIQDTFMRLDALGEEVHPIPKIRVQVAERVKPHAWYTGNKE